MVILRYPYRVLDASLIGEKQLQNLAEHRGKLTKSLKVNRNQAWWAISLRYLPTLGRVAVFGIAY